MNFKNLLSVFLFLCFSCSVSAQSKNVFQTTGFSFSYFKFSAFDVGEGLQREGVQYQGYGVQYNYRFRYNLKDLNDDNSLSVEVIPAVGLDYGDYTNTSISGIGGFRMPIYAAFNTGAGSTYDSSKNFGFGLGAGLDINYNPVLFLEGEGGDLDFKKLFIDPSIQLNFRYWKSSTSTLREFYIRYNFSSNDNDFDSNSNIDKPIHIVIGWMTYLNY